MLGSGSQSATHRISVAASGNLADGKALPRDNGLARGRRQPVGWQETKPSQRNQSDSPTSLFLAMTAADEVMLLAACARIGASIADERDSDMVDNMGIQGIDERIDVSGEG